MRRNRFLRHLQRHVGTLIGRAAHQPPDRAGVRENRQAARMENKHRRARQTPHARQEDEVAQERHPLRARRRIEKHAAGILPEDFPSLADQAEQMPDLLPLEAPHFQHLLAELHPQPVHLEFRPVVFEQDLRRHRLAVPRRRGLAHQEDVGFLGRHCGERDFEF